MDIRFDSDAQETKNRWCRAKRSKQAAPGREWLIYYDTGSEMRGTEKNEKKCKTCVSSLFFCVQARIYVYKQIDFVILLRSLLIVERVFCTRTPI